MSARMTKARWRVLAAACERPLLSAEVAALVNSAIPQAKRGGLGTVYAKALVSAGLLADVSPVVGGPRRYLATENGQRFNRNRGLHP